MSMIHRNAYDDLVQWQSRSSRKPLVVRGARQVGKSFLIRAFGQREFDNLIELNFENEPECLDFFDRADLIQGLKLLALHKGQPIVPGKTLLFLDEIQAVPKMIARLRYLYEQIPDLHVVAAGSLLDLVLANPPFSVPVGRIEYLHLGPLRFSEFLSAIGKSQLNALLAEFQLGESMPAPIHRQLLECLRTYFICGGMPESVVAAANDNLDPTEGERARSSILDTLTEDFGKYGAQIDTQLLRLCFRRLPQLTASQLKYVMLSRDYKAATLAKALQLLQQARVCHIVHRTAAASIPLAAGQDDKRFKPLFLDVGLMLHALGLSVASLPTADFMAANEGAIAEQFVGQHLLYRRPSYRNPELFYWARDKGAAAEVDYIIESETHAIPIEVKAGKSGSLRSLNYYMVHQGAPCGVRLNVLPPTLTEASGRLTTGQPYTFPLISLPLYMVEQIPRIVQTHAST